MFRAFAAAERIAWPVAIDPSLTSLTIADVSRSDLAAASFLDHRLQPEGGLQLRDVSIDTIMRDTAPAGTDPVFIIHSAFCGSTLLARLLDKPGTCLSLKEPHVLAQLAQAKRDAGGTALASLSFGPLARVLDAALALMRRHDDPHTLIKPTNFVNNLIPDLLARNARILFLHSGLESFLQSLVRRGAEASIFIRSWWRAILADGLVIANIPPASAMLYTDLQIAAILWTQQMELFRHWLERQPAQCAALDFDEFAGAEALFAATAAGFLFSGRDPAVLIDQPDSDALARDSKTGTCRRAIERTETLDPRDQAVIADTLTWAASIRLSPTAPWPLPGRLSIDGPTEGAMRCQP